jgi:predicted ATP-binding protein involved in virulence
MRLIVIEAIGVLPVKRFSVDGLSEVIVIAGPNGVGKSRLVDGMLNKFQHPPGYPNTRLVIQATSPAEKTEWGKETLDTSNSNDANLLTLTLQKSKSRRNLSSSVIHFESDRSIQQVTAFPFSFDIQDPWQEMMGWNQTFSGLKARFSDTLHSLFRKVQSHEKEIAQRALAMQRAGQQTMELDFPDPLKAFKDAFSLLVSPKVLLTPDPRHQQLFYEYEGASYPLSAMSSGEREVVNIVFDFILRTSSDCIVFFDEPELHLHPELSYKLLQALRASGTRNQFIFCTHSPEIITASLDQTVIFLAPPANDQHGNPKNQAICVSEDDTTNLALKLLGQSIGVVALGRRLVLIEGTTSSLDKQTYGLLLKSRFPNLVLVPTGGKDLIRSFSQIVQNVLNQAIWGVDFFMLCDRDSAQQTELAQLESTSGGKLRFLKKYHLENYFLDSRVISKMFEDQVPSESWLRDPIKIEKQLRDLASESLSYASALIVSDQIRRSVGNVSVMPKGNHDKPAGELADLVEQRSAEELQRVQSSLAANSLRPLVEEVYSKLRDSLTDGSDRWKSDIPGKQILAKFAKLSGLELSRFKLLYVNTAERESIAVFDEVITLFSDFSQLSTSDNFTLH